MEIDPKDQKAWNDYVESHYRPTKLGKWLLCVFLAAFFLHMLISGMLE